MCFASIYQKWLYHTQLVGAGVGVVKTEIVAGAYGTGEFGRDGPEVGEVSLTGQQINWLLDGYDLGAMKGHRKLHYEATF